MKRLSIFLLLVLPLSICAQVVTTSPAFPVANQPVTITIDVSGTTIDHYAWDNTTKPVYLWTWIRKSGTADIDAPTNVNPATAAQAAAKATRISTNPDKYQITITPTTFFNKAATDIPQIGLLLKTTDWNSNLKSGNDKFIEFGTGFNASFSTPSQPLFLVNNNDQFPITINASESSSLTIKVNGSVVASQSAVATLTYNHTVTETAGTTQVVGEAVAGAQSKTVYFSYTIRSATSSSPRPAGIKDGINYSADATKATLSLWAPGKSSVYVLGDFTNWDLSSTYQMKQDGEHFWLEITGLTAGTEYGFQYYVDETIRIADPYADKILDPDDKDIPATTYPSLKAFPAKALSDKWYFNRVAVLQTNEAAYTWQTTNFQKPAAEKLVIYELLVRDFFGSNGRNYQNLIDTLSYFKRLGINAIELMPITEFNGNDSWGYNPAFMFAPDKYYGTKNKLKEFVDKCHQNGIAVIMDIVMNQQDLPNPYVMMDFDFAASKPTANNKWFNTTATHPYSVFYDLNHESLYTKKYLDSVNYYWLNEYKVDGYRYDLSKGFTQTNNPTDVGAWGAYDASRIAILKRMADKVWAHTPNAYIILEHFAANAEEKELAEYRSGEGKRMMLWANFNTAYNQSTMGYSSDSDISNIYFGNKSWTVPGAVGYMESHDEERLMYKDLQFGNANASYTVKSVNTSLERIKGANLVFYTIPGPKMLWQFGELGYDFSINTCADGTIKSDCRVSAKPVKWEYRLDANRKSLFTMTADLIRLRKTYAVFTSGDAIVSSGTSLLKQVMVKSKPYNAAPVTAAEMNIVAVTNFDIVKQTVAVVFPHTGTWYDYYQFGSSVNVNSVNFSMDLNPGQYKLFTDVKIDNPVVTGVEEGDNDLVVVYPNPAGSVLKVNWNGGDKAESVTLISMQGIKFLPAKIDSNSWDVNGITSGLYVVEIKSGGLVVRKKIIKL